MDRFFEDFFTEFDNDASYSSWNSRKVPLDIHELNDSYEIIFDLPGVKKEDVHIEVDDNILTISTERKNESKEEKGKFYRFERFSGRLARSLKLPDNINGDNISAKCDNGVLTVKIEKLPNDKNDRDRVKIISVD
jgi:HSP20 family protein